MANIMLLFQNKGYFKLVCAIVCFLIIGVVWPQISSADSAEEIYQEAARCHDRLLNSSLRQKFRQFWLTCLNAYQRVYAQSPESEWAPVALYQSGLLYLEFYEKYKKESYQERGLENLKKVVEDYPDTPYRAKAFESLKKAEGKSSHSAENKVTEMPLEDKASEASSEKNIQEKASKTEPPPQKASADAPTDTALNSDADAGSLETQRRAAIEKIKRRLTKTTVPSSASTNLDEPAKIPDIAEKKPKGPEENQVRLENRNKPVVIDQVRIISNSEQTRMVIYAENESPFFPHLLAKDIKLNKPQRFYVDIENARLGKNVKREIPINDDILYSARAGQFTSQIARVVVDFKSFGNYKISSQKDPFRIVVDFWGENGNQ